MDPFGPLDRCLTRAQLPGGVPIGPAASLYLQVTMPDGTMARSNAQFWRLMVAGLADSHSKSQAREAGGGSIVKAMGSQDLRQIDPPGSWPSWLSIVLMSLGWGAAWAIGLMAVNNVAPLTGWLTLGAIGGLVTARVLHSSHPSLSVTRLIMVIVGWAGAGLCSASVTNYDVVTGWVSMGILGGGVTGLAAARRKSSQMFLSVFVAMVGWVTAGVIGARIASTGGRQVGFYIGTAVGGRVIPFIVWGVAWAIGGCVTGALGGALMSWRYATAKSPAEPDTN